MKIKHILLGLAAIAFVSCKKDDTTTEVTYINPLIENTEIGIENSKKGYAESDLHFQTQISSPAGIASVRVQILPRHYGNAWFVDKTYLWEGKKDDKLHIHYDIPKKALPAGLTQAQYDVIITATDLNGKKTIVEDVLTIINDPDLPKIAQGTQSYDKDTKKVTLKAKIKAPNKIKELRYRIGPNINGSFSDGKYIGQTEVDFEETLDGSAIPNPNHFHSYLTVTDEKGKTFTIDLGAH